jgi:DNA-binding transcriptional LysR family regulator
VSLFVEKNRLFWHLISAFYAPMGEVMDLASRLLLLLDVHEQGSYAKVASMRNVDRSVVSKHITQLEESMGVRLLNRTTRSLSLTAAGQEMVQRANCLRQLLTDTQKVAEDFHLQPQGALRITATSYFGRQFVQPVILKLQQRFPKIKFQLYLDDRINDLIGEGFDVGFRIGRPQDSTLVQRRLARNRMLLVAAPELIERYGMPETLADLQQIPAVIFAKQGFVYNKLEYRDEQGHERLLELNDHYWVNDVDVLIGTVKAGHMMAVASSMMIEDEIRNGELIPLMTDLNIIDFGALYVMYPHRDAPLKTRLLIDAMVEAIGGDQPVWERNIPGFDAMYSARYQKVNAS